MPSLEFKLYNHKLGQCGLSFLAIPKLAKKYQKGFPESLTDAPLLLPSEHSMVRRSLDLWMRDKEIYPHVVAEFEDSALLKTFGEAGEGIFPIPTAIEKRVCERYGVALVGTIPEVMESYYAISAEKRVQHHATSLILHQARNELFDLES